MDRILPLLQIVSGVAWFVPAVYLTPRIFKAWRRDATRAHMLSAPIGFLAWLQTGFTVRWLAWPRAVDVMEPAELATWAALYALSAFLAVWFLVGAYQTRRD